MREEGFYYGGYDFNNTHQSLHSNAMAQHWIDNNHMSALCVLRHLAMESAFDFSFFFYFFLPGEN